MISIPAFHLLRQRDFALLLSGQVGSGIGDGLLKIAILLHVYNLTGSARATTIAFLAETAPMAVLSVFAGTLVDRWDRKQLLIAADVARLVTLLPLLFVRSADGLWLIYVTLALHASVATVFFPAFRASLPAVVPREDLPRANALFTLSSNVFEILVPPAGAALLAFGGLAAVVVVDALSFVVSVVTIALTRLPRRLTEPDAVPTTYRRDLREGLGYVRRSRVLVAIFTSIVLLGFAQGGISPLIVPYLSGVLGASEVEVGWTFTGLTIGSIVGGVVVGGVVTRFGLRATTVVGGGATALLLVGYAVSPSAVVAMVLLAVLGLPSVWFNIGLDSLVQVEVPDRLLGRVFGSMTAAGMLTGLAAGAAPLLLLDLLGVRGILELAAVMAIAGATVLGVGLLRSPAPAVSAVPTLDS